MDYDAIIVGGGPAGLSAALVLARARRRVVVIDAGRPRNYASQHAYNFLTRDGIHPAQLLELGREEIARYGAEFRRDVVTSAECVPGGFAATLRSGGQFVGRTLLLGTGVTDELPNIQNIDAFYGRGVHHCPYCDGWNYSDKPLAAFGVKRAGLGLALNLMTWSRNVTVVTHGNQPARTVLREAARWGIPVRTEPVVRLESVNGQSQPGKDDPFGRIVFESGPELRVDAMFFNTDQVQRSDLPKQLGCKINDLGGVVRDRRQRTGVPGLYLAGDASVDVQFVVVAAAEGVKAGMTMNRELQERDRKALEKARAAAPAHATPSAAQAQERVSAAPK